VIFQLVFDPAQTDNHFIDKHNQSPKPFIWTAKASDILEKVKRARRALDDRR
jgi:hypothetical protein